MSIEQLRKCGDTLECHMFADPIFCQWFEGYAKVWSQHVQNRRKEVDGVVSIEPAWEEFAQKNYTAIVRCWNARIIQQQILAIIGNKPGPSGQLELHGLLASFFALTRVALENLVEAFVSRGLVSENKWTHVKEMSGEVFPNLGWIRHMRHELLHDRLLPIWISDNNEYVIDGGLIPSRSGESASWHEGPGSWMSLKEFVNEVWAVYPKQMNDQWNLLNNKLLDVFGSRSPDPNNPLYSKALGTGSGTPLMRGDLS